MHFSALVEWKWWDVYGNIKFAAADWNVSVNEAAMKCLKKQKQSITLPEISSLIKNGQSQGHINNNLHSLQRTI